MKSRSALILCLVWAVPAACSQVRDHRRPKPDLQITDISQDPPSPIANQIWRFKVTIENRGTADAVFPQGAKYMARGTPGSWTPIGAGSKITIPPGGVYAGIQYPGNYNAGTYPITFKVDPDDVIPERDETNNEFTSTYTIRPGGTPDLVITSITSIPTAPTTAGFRLAVTVKNQGSGVAVAQEGGALLKSVGSDTVLKTGVMHLLPGASIVYYCDPIRYTAGSWTWNLAVDPANRVAEIDEKNNTRSVSLSIGAGPEGKPDLVITQIATEPAQPTVGGNGRFVVTIKNQGIVDAFIPEEYPYLAENLTGTGATGPFEGVTWGGGFRLAPGATFTGIKYSPVNNAGTFTITFRADPENVLYENNEGNNEKTFTFTVQ